MHSLSTHPGTILELREVTVFRGDRMVFERLSLTLMQGVQTAILGPNGSGKSTLLKMLSNELHPWPDDRAVFRLFGQDRWNVWDLRTQLGIVSHDLQRDYDGSATVSEVLLSGFYASSGIYPHQSFSAAQRTRVRQVADAVGVLPLLDRMYLTLSTGEQRRCLLGRALVHRPRVLILDEPTSGLDPRAASIYLEHVRGLMSSGTTVVIVTHHVHEIPPEVSRVILMKEGRIWADSGREELLTSSRLSDLYETPLDLVRAGGYVYTVPTGHSQPQSSVRS